MWALTCRVSNPVTATQAQAYLGNVLTVVDVDAADTGRCTLHGVTVSVQVGKDPPVFEDRPVEVRVLIGAETNVSAAVRQRILDRIAAVLPCAQTIFFAINALTDAQVDARLLQWATELGCERIWQTNRATSFAGLATDPSALAARFSAVDG